VLDSECHSYVIPTSEKPGYNHLVIENEFDRYLLTKDRKNALHYPIWKTVCSDHSVVDAIHHTYRPLGVKKKKIKKALKGMRFYKRLLTCGATLRRLIIRAVMKLTFHYQQLEGHMMTLNPKYYAKETNAALSQIYKDAIPLAAKLIQDFHHSVIDKKPLHPRFFCTFKSNVRMR
jgi:hypothetical protein